MLHALALTLAKRERNRLDMALRQGVDPDSGLRLTVSRRKMIFMRYMEIQHHVTQLAGQLKEMA